MSRVKENSIQRILDNILSGNTDYIDSIIKKDSVKGDIIPYSYIQEYVRNLREESIERLEFNLYDIRDLVSENEENYNKSSENIEKIVECMLMEINRVNDSNRLNNDLKQLERILKEARNQEDEIEQKMKIHAKKIEKMQGDFISILSIFSAVIIAFFGGINLLGNTLTSINGTNKYRLIFIVTLIGIILFNVIYMLLYSIARLTNKSIGVSRKHRACKKCTKSITLGCIANKYPIVFFFNIVSIIILIVDSFLYFVDKYNFITFITKDLWFLSGTKDAIMIIIILSFIITLSLIFMLRKKIESLFECDFKGMKEKIVDDISSKEIEEDKLALDITEALKRANEIFIGKK
ncbi:hypothetical protein ACSXDV_12785 [Clostridium perfringens]